jgi:hypothetical protein
VRDKKFLMERLSSGEGGRYAQVGSKGRQIRGGFLGKR